MLVPRVKVIGLWLLWIFQPGAEGMPGGNVWLTFGQLAAITFISWLVIKRGNKAGDQDVSFWMNEFAAIRASLVAIEKELAILTHNDAEERRAHSKAAGHH